MSLFLSFAAFCNSEKHVTGQNSEVTLKLTFITVNNMRTGKLQKKQNIWYGPLSPGKKKHTSTRQIITIHKHFYHVYCMVSEQLGYI